MTATGTRRLRYIFGQQRNEIREPLGVFAHIQFWANLMIMSASEEWFGKRRPVFSEFLNLTPIFRRTGWKAEHCREFGRQRRWTALT
jgi:hypothetical protein